MGGPRRCQTTPSQRWATVLRAHLEHDSLPWADTAISGWVLDPDRKKMSKSKGNVVTPLGLLQEHGSDAVRYWAASGRPGTDTAFDTGQMRVGRRLAIKLLNASKFVLARTAPRGPVTEPLDRGLLTSLARLVDQATADFEAYDYARVLENTESWFWSFCDNYLELVKSRRYGDRGDDSAGSANSALLMSLSTVLRLFAPFMPFATEEVWSWWQTGSVHRAAWPTSAEIMALIDRPDEDGEHAMRVAIDVLGTIRRRKSEEQRGMKTAVSRLVVRGTDADLRWLELVRVDLVAAGSVERVETAPHASLEVSVELAPADSAAP